MSKRSAIFLKDASYQEVSEATREINVPVSLHKTLGWYMNCCISSLNLHIYLQLTAHRFDGIKPLDVLPIKGLSSEGGFDVPAVNARLPAVKV